MAAISFRLRELGSRRSECISRSYEKLSHSALCPARVEWLSLSVGQPYGGSILWGNKKYRVGQWLPPYDSLNTDFLSVYIYISLIKNTYIEKLPP